MLRTYSTLANDMGVKPVSFVFPCNHYFLYCCNWLTCLWFVVQEDLVGRNNRAIVDALKVMAQANEALHANQNHNGGLDEFRGMGKFHKNKPHMFKGRCDPKGSLTWIQEIEKIFKVMACTDTKKSVIWTSCVI